MLQLSFVSLIFSNVAYCYVHIIRLYVLPVLFAMFYINIDFNYINESSERQICHTNNMCCSSVLFSVD